MKPILNALMLLSLILTTSCERSGWKSSSNEGASVVELRQNDGKYRLYVDNKEFYVKGAGCECWHIESLAKNGGNSFRTWADSIENRDGLEILDEAHNYGLKVLMGLRIGKERHGFDYNDPEAVARQQEEVRKIIFKYKDHPALLGWGIGNELNLKSTNLKVWDAVNDISKMIHEIDKNHPTTTMFAGINRREVEYLKKIGSDLDFLSIQMYGDIINLETRLRDAGYDGPYLITEWGATGHWEMPSTDWGAPIEQTSTEKASALIERYNNVILADDNNCLGSYVFLWGQKQERTPTWYGLFTENGEKMETISTMYYLWNNEWPVQRAPSIDSARLDGKDRFDNIILASSKDYYLSLKASDFNGDSLKVRMEILKESTDLKDGGDKEEKPDRVDAAIMDFNEEGFHFSSPSKSGAYRLFIYVLDEHNNAATINFPFLVRD